jgi:hypothetical protein
MKDPKNITTTKSINRKNGNNTGIILIIFIITALLAAWLLLPDKNSHQHGDEEHGHQGSAEAEYAKGPHGGRLLTDENFDL